MMDDTFKLTKGAPPGEDFRKQLTKMSPDQVKGMMDASEQIGAEKPLPDETALDIAKKSAWQTAKSFGRDGAVVGAVAAGWTKLRRNPFTWKRNFGKPALIGGAISGLTTACANISYEVGKREGLQSSVRYDEDGTRHMHVYDGTGHHSEHVLKPDPGQKGAYVHEFVDHGIDPSPPRIIRAIRDGEQLVAHTPSGDTPIIRVESPSKNEAPPVEAVSSKESSAVADILAKGPQTPAQHAIVEATEETAPGRG